MRSEDAPSRGARGEATAYRVLAGELRASILQGRYAEVSAKALQAAR